MAGGSPSTGSGQADSRQWELGTMHYKHQAPKGEVVVAPNPLTTYRSPA